MGYLMVLAQSITNCKTAMHSPFLQQQSIVPYSYCMWHYDQTLQIAFVSSLNRRQEEELRGKVVVVVLCHAY